MEPCGDVANDKIARTQLANFACKRDFTKVTGTRRASSHRSVIVFVCV